MFVGIVVRERMLELAATGEATELPPSVRNSPEGIATIVAALKAAAPRLTVVESTGSDSLPLLAWLVVAKLPVATVDAAQISVIRSRPGIEGTDAQLLARFAAMHHAELRSIDLDASVRTRLFQFVDLRDLRVASQAKARRWQRRAITEGVAKIVELAGKELEHAEVQLREIDEQIASLLGIQLE